MLGHWFGLIFFFTSMPLRKRCVVAKSHVIFLPFTGPERYGDECCYGKTSLLHFIVFFFLGGLTLLIVGVVQFKEEAGLHHARHHFLVGKIIR